MTDFLKILSYDIEFAETLYKNPLLKTFSNIQKFSNKLDQENKNIKSTYIKSYKEILFCFYTKDEVFTKLEILFKPHYYFNDNLHNANDFTALDCIKTLTEIKNTFKFPASELYILNLEFGLNAISPIDIRDLISCAIYHEKNEFINSSDSLRFSKISFKHHKDGKANKYKQIKFYAKGFQFSQYVDNNTFRFEVKSKESKYIKTLGIKTYADLLKVETYKTLADVIRLEFKKVLILDITSKVQNLTNKEHFKLNEYLNTIKWIKSLQCSRNLFSKHKIDYFRLLDKTKNNIHSKLNFIIDEKLNELLKPCAISTPKKIVKLCAISDVYIIGNCTLNNIKKCSVTGLDLSKEKEGSKYIKTTTLKYLREFDKKRFAEVCSLLLNNSKPYHTKYESDIISHLYKQVRNRFYNSNQIKNIGYKSKVYHNQLSLRV
ncbi:type 2 periplasmic-binding domain-containing protein [Polaribacter glomeratus]|uniref:Uncharacterized protein n=1 Tax=Polaribacter glomeratus TaxID=102 RepID=A0A2S7WH77_9FLAO|nr:hypothetical protein [Polaribacter glomeratus]PQJ76970.1 hypothetical protein BTO16_14010 [Polaribacter glomeratus]TXD67181.1 hypothetical protein ESX12_00905 [Polaribacter glomeratus]